MATPRELFDAFRDCALRNDGEGLVALCSEDVVMEFPFSKVRFRGTADVRDCAALAWHVARRRLCDFQFVRIADAPGMVVAEYELVGHIDGRPFRAGAVMLLEARGGKIAALREYVDPTSTVASAAAPVVVL
jgi:ketosteroid isomerase-like protein